MANWLAKAAVQKAISILPQGHRINYVFQKYVTKMRLDDARMDQALVHCGDHIRHLLEDRSELTGLATLELGTGWYGIVPLGMFLCGVDRVTTVDVTPLLRAENLTLALAKFLEYHESGRLTSFLPHVDAGRLAIARALLERTSAPSVRDICDVVHMDYIVADVRGSSVPEGTYDLIHSNDVFEHIEPPVLEEILVRFKRVGKDGAVMSHFIDMSDHFAHFDKSVSVYNYLRYSDRQWKLIDNSLAPQNRCRLPEYRELYRKAGVAILDERQRPGDVAELRKTPLAERFKRFPESEAAITHAYVISKLGRAA